MFFWSLFFSSLVSTKFRLDRERGYFSQEFCVEKLVLTSFRGYLGEIESERKKEGIELFLL